MAITHIDPQAISFNNLTDLRRTATTSNISSCRCPSPIKTTDSSKDVDTGISYHSQMRAKIRMMADANSEIISKHDGNQKSLNALHQIKMLLKKTGKMLAKFGSEEFLTQKPDLLAHKIEKLISKLNRIAERAGIEFEDIEDPIPGEILPTPDPEPVPTTHPQTPPADPNVPAPPPVDEPDPSAPVVGVGDLVPVEPEVTPDVSTPVDQTTPTDETIPESEPVENDLPAEIPQSELPSIKEGLIFTIESSLTRIADMESNLLIEQYNLKGSLVYLNNPLSDSQPANTETPNLTSIEFALEATRTQMMSNSGKAVYAQTLNFTFDIVSLLN
jgi:hypothetical protein